MALASIDADTLSHNATLLASLEVGDLVQYKRGVYSHYAVYIGEEEVVHLTGDGPEDHLPVNSGHVFTICGKRFQKSLVRRDSFWKAANGDKAYKKNTKDGQRSPLSPQEIRKRALSRLGPVNYNILCSNCEHFATWCRYDEESSDQVDTVWKVVGGTTLAVLGAMGVAHIVSKKSRNEENKY